MSDTPYEYMSRKIAELQDEVRAIELRLLKVREECKHPDLFFVNLGGFEYSIYLCRWCGHTELR